MAKCQYFGDCEFVLQYVSRVRPHWDDFVTLYCDGDFQDVCKRLEWFTMYGEKPSAELMPTGRQVSVLVGNDE